MKQSKRIVYAVCVAAALISGCGREQLEETCEPTMTNLSPTKGDTFKVDAGQITRFHAEPKACVEGANYGVRWVLNDEVVAYANDYDFIACNEDEGVHHLMAQAITYATTDTASVEKVVAQHKWAINVRGISKPTPPKCYAQSIKDIQNTNNAGDPTEMAKLQSAVECLDGYLEIYACDFKASYASGLAKSAIFGESLYPYYQQRMELTVDDIKKIVKEKIEPIRRNFLVVEQKAPEDFAFNVDGRFRIYAFKDDPNLEGDDTIFFDGYGHHDKSEALFIMTFMNWFDGGLSIGLANLGSLEFGLHTPDDETPVTGSERLITQLEKDPRFLTFDDGTDKDGKPLNDGSGAEGRRLMGLAQNSFIQAFKQTIGVFQRVQAETHDQTMDPIRYWDCGEDAICPATCSYMDGLYFNADRKADPPEYGINWQSCEQDGVSYDDKNMNTKCDEGWKQADAGECNGKYDDGEALGTERIGFGSQTHGERIGPSTDIPKVIKVLQILQENVRGPDFLDLDNIATVAADLPPKSVSSFMEGLGVPYPVVRISEFFVTPTEIRDLIPLYDKQKKQFIISLEAEPYLDTGYDGKLNAQETGYDRINNPDPHRDDLDPYCNPDCNESDELPNGTWVDNDGDGKANWSDDNWFTMDLGVEGNLVFDFIDLKDPVTGLHNGLHDVGETSEPYDDVGTVNAAGKKFGAGNQKWDKADRAHQWPTGSNVGPVVLNRPDDPPNGAIFEQPNGLFDNYYFFFQDPTISGALHFVVNPHDLEKEMESANGEVLTDNARMMRFSGKILELMADPPLDVDPIREANAHPCVSTTANCNHWDNSTGEYQP